MAPWASQEYKQVDLWGLSRENLSPRERSTCMSAYAAHGFCSYGGRAETSNLKKNTKKICPVTVSIGLQVMLLLYGTQQMRTK